MTQQDHIEKLDRQFATALGRLTLIENAVDLEKFEAFSYGPQPATTQPASNPVNQFFEQAVENLRAAEKGESDGE